MATNVVCEKDTTTSEIKLPYTDEDLKKSIECVKALDYPHEIVWYEVRSKPRDLSIIDKHERTTVEKLPYSFLTNLTPGFRKNMKNLGLIAIDIDELNACNTITSSYSLNVRVRSRRHDVPMSCEDYWRSEKENVLAIAVTQLPKHFDRYTPEQLPPKRDALENECAIALFKTGIPGCFPSTLVTTLIDELATRPEFKGFAEKVQSKKIHMLDISAGWGDRMLAACSRDYWYTGCDPNTEMQPCYIDILKNHGIVYQEQILGGYRMQAVICSPFEDWDGKSNSRYETTTNRFCSDNLNFRYEIVPPNCMVSSPPFFNLEIYSHESTQSSERYPAIDDWVQKFLKPSLQKSSEILAPNSPVVLHLSDVIDFKNPSKSIIFVESVITWCVNKLGWKFIGNYGFTNRDIHKESEDQQIRKEKDANKLIAKGVVKKYDNGLRCNNKGEYFSQPLWVFRT